MLAAKYLAGELNKMVGDQSHRQRGVDLDALSMSTESWHTPPGVRPMVLYRYIGRTLRVVI